MSEIEADHANIFLFILGNGTGGYAEVTSAFRRKAPASRQQAWGEIESNWVREPLWGEVPPKLRPGGIDIALDANQASLVFVAIDNAHHHSKAADGGAEIGLMHETVTYFGKNVVRELDICGKPQSPVIKDAKCHKRPGDTHDSVCSFEFDGVSVMSELGAAGAGTTVRFPIVFDFVDSDDGRSPVFKKPNGLHIMNHGGIHPPTGSSLIIVG